MTLWGAPEGKAVRIRDIHSDDRELTSFLFSLGCYSGEEVTLVSRRRGSCTIAVKDGRYSMDPDLAGIIEIEE